MTTSRDDYLDPSATDLASQIKLGIRNDIRLGLPTPHALQREIMAHRAPRKVVIAGRRGGKTVMAGMIACRSFFRGQAVLIVSTTADQANAFWTNIRSWLSPLIEAGIVYKNDSSNLLIYRTPEGKLGRIKARTGSNPDVLRGGSADLLIMDEAAYLEERAWRDVGAPMLLDREGKAIFISTPNKKGWLYGLYLKGKDEQQTDWKSWHFPTYKNPHLPKAALERMISDMTEESYRQEIEAEFLAGAGAVFNNLDAVINLPLISRDPGVYKVKEPYEGRFVAGVDWAQTNDFTVVSIMDVVTGNIVLIERFNRMDWAVMRERVKRILKQWKVDRAVVETNSVGRPAFEALLAERVPVVGFETTAESKPRLIQTMQLEFERGSIHLPKHETVRGEFEVFERVQGQRSYKSRYEAPLGSHDDIVIACCLANYARQNIGSTTGIW